MQDLKNVMTWQNYAIANSNAMDGLNETSTIESVNTWYDNALLAAQIVFAVLTLACVSDVCQKHEKRKLIKGGKRQMSFLKKQVRGILFHHPYGNIGCGWNDRLPDQLWHRLFFKPWH